MKNLLNPKWIFLTSILPIALLLFIEWGEFNIIKSLLTEESVSLWRNFAVILVIIALCNAIYAVVQIINKKTINILYCISSLTVYTFYIYSYYAYSSDILPRSIPQWMISGNLSIYVGTFLMPAVLYSLLAIVVLLDNKEKETVRKDIMAALVIPALFLFFSLIIVPAWNGVETIGPHIFMTGVIIFTVLFLFFLIRGVYAIVTRRGIYKENKLVFKIVISIILPFFSLLLNDHVFSHLFGDFSNIWFYILAVLNGIFICLPPLNKPVYRLLLFAGRCITLIYTTYFFLVFVPFLPFSLLAIIFFGMGLLMLTPLLLFVIHITEISADFKYLKRNYKTLYLYGTLVGGLFIIPVAITINYVYDKKMLHKTLDYIYSADYTKEYKLNAESVLRTIDTIDETSSESDSFYSSTPFLSAYFKWLVLDNLNLSEGRKNMIRNLFSGNFSHNNGISTRFGNTSRPNIQITDIKHTSKYDNKQKAWISQIDLEITNTNTELRNSEYKTFINLPVGCWISDYYLYVGDVKEPGILTEKKAATWVFNQIRTVNQDPGLLRYISGNTVEFKVFPFNINETRKTGIEFIHKEPVSLVIDGNVLSLGFDEDLISIDRNTTKQEVIYVSAQDKKGLETIERIPYYHFIVDMSANKKTYDSLSDRYSDKKNGIDSYEKYIGEIEDFLDKDLIDGRNAKISYTNAYVKTYDLKGNWREDLKKQQFEGGFFLDRAIRKILFENYMNHKDCYPVIVVVSNTFDKAIILENLADMQFTYPENGLFYSLEDGNLKAHTFATALTTIKEKTDTLPVCRVKAWPTAVNPLAYIPDNNKPSIILNTKNKIRDIRPENIQEKSWKAGLDMHSQWMLQILYPETADQEWLNLVDNSFKSRIMTPLTSYIVVENEAQKAILKNKQDEVLSGKRALDLNEETQEMSEPDLLIIIILFGLFYFVYNKRKKRAIK